jgi:hypothetical protein
MAQRMVDIYKNQKSVCTQTGDDVEFFVSLSDSKHARLYYSESYKDIVLSFNINQCKSFIVTRQMWKNLRNHINKIDLELGR